jgi:hypothetical protein
MKVLRSPEALTQLLTFAITIHETARIALLHIVELSALQQILSGLFIILVSFLEAD